ncbi:MAG TPA: phosphatase PAP2 family protein [Firmicutes bacterium]|jgi:undecaprenyl-diphosphatase|nr:phosphatase PAP2 family protein [Bacillota bacterium]
MKKIFSAIRRADLSLFLAINRLQSNWQNKSFSLLTNLGGLCFQACLALFLILLPSTRNTGFKLGISQIVVAGSVQLIKLIVSRSRPYIALANIVPLKTARDYSFPSGHTAVAFSAALTINALVPLAISIIGFTLAALIGYSRIYIGVHYPSDVIVGGLIGYVIAGVLLLVL